MRLPPPPPNATPGVLRATGQELAALPTTFTVLGELGLELKTTGSKAGGFGLRLKVA